MATDPRGPFRAAIKVEIRIVAPSGEFTTIQEQHKDSVGRVSEPSASTLRRAVEDARSWLRKNGGDR